jgi:hypothetical protein
MPGAREGWSSASSHRHSLRQLNWKRSGGGGGNSSCGDLPSSAAAGPPLVKHSALYGDPCPLCRPGAAGSLSAPLGGCESRVRAGDGPEAAAEVDNGGVRADGGGAAVEAGIGGDGSRAGGGRLVHGARATRGSESNAARPHVIAAAACWHSRRRLRRYYSSRRLARSRSRTRGAVQLVRGAGRLS